MLFTVIKFDKALNLAVIEPRAMEKNVNDLHSVRSSTTANGNNTTVWADNILNIGAHTIPVGTVSKFTHPDVGERIEARFDLLINTIEQCLQSTETVITEDDGEI